MRPLLRVLKENNGYHFAKGGTRALRWKTVEGTMVGLRWWWLFVVREKPRVPALVCARADEIFYERRDGPRLRKTS